MTDLTPAVDAPVEGGATPLFETAMDMLTDARAQVTNPRITNDEHGLLIAMAVALRADCTRRRVGAVIVDVHGRIVGTGRNGAPAGRPGCLSAGACPRGLLTYEQVAPGSTYSAGAGACIALHAEVNACLYTDASDRRGGTIYVSDPPCDGCSNAIAGSGLARAVWPEKTETGWVVRSIDVASSPIGGNYS